MRSLSPEIRARQAMKRWASSTSDISSEKKATALFALTATFSAMFATSALFPIAGRAATMIRLPGWKPPVIASMSRKPAGVPVISISPVESFSRRSTSSWRISAEQAEVARLLFVGDFEEQLLGPLRELPRLAGPLVDPALDLLAGAEQPPQQRVLLDDLRVVLGVAGRGHFRGKLGDVVLASRFVDLVALGQRLGDAELVDRLGVRVEVVRGFEDQPVPIEVEVRRVQLHLVDYPRQRRLGDQHRPDHRFLGFDVLRRDVGGGWLWHLDQFEGGSRRTRQT